MCICMYIYIYIYGTPPPPPQNPTSQVTNSQIRRFVAPTNLQICESAFPRENADSQIRRFVAPKQSAHLRICVFLEKTQIRRFADLWPPTNLHICESAFPRENADSQICSPKPICKSANLRFLEKTQIRRFEICVFLEKTQIRRFAEVCVFLEKTQIRRFADL